MDNRVIKTGIGTFRALSGTLAVAALLRCGGAPDELRPPVAVGDGVSAESLGKDGATRELGAPGSVSPLPIRGGFGGVDFGPQDGGIVYAYRVRSGLRVDQFRLAWYMPSQPDRRLRRYGRRGLLRCVRGGWLLERYRRKDRRGSRSTPRTVPLAVKGGGAPPGNC
jgi:hypothetical protein